MIYWQAIGSSLLKCLCGVISNKVRSESFHAEITTFDFEGMFTVQSSDGKGAI